MTIRKMRSLIALGCTGFVVALISIPELRARGFYPFGSWTDEVMTTGFAVCLGTFAWVHGWCMGNAEVDEIVASGDEQYAEDQASIDRLVELIDAARTDVEDNLRFGSTGWSDLVDSGPLSLRAQNRAVAGLPFDPTYDEVLTDAATDQRKG